MHPTLSLCVQFFCLCFLFISYSANGLRAPIVFFFPLPRCFFQLFFSILLIKPNKGKFEIPRFLPSLS